MSGALTRLMARRQRGYAGGGGVTDDPAMDMLYPAAALLRQPAPPDQDGSPDQDYYRAAPPPPMPAPTPVAAGRAPPQAGALAHANPEDAEPAPAPTQGALGQNMQGGGGSPDQQDPDAQRKMFDLNRTMAVLQASRAGIGINPMLQAAGAMLAPTRTGGFAESLGAGFTAAGKAGEQERATDEQMAERLLQAQWQNDYRQQMAAAATSRATTYGNVGEARIPLMQAQSGMDMARAAYLQARAAAGAAAHVTPGDLQAQAMNSLLAPDQSGAPPVNPDTGKPFTKLEAFQATQAALPSVQGANIRAGTAADRLAAQKPLIDARVEALQGTADYHNQLIALKAQGLSDAAAKAQLDAQIRQQQTDILQQNADTNSRRADQQAEQFQQTQQFHDGVQALRQRGVDFNQALAVGTLASKIMAAKPGTKWSEAFAQAQQGLPGPAGQPAAPAATAPAPAARPAAAGAPPAAPAGPKPQAQSSRPSWTPPNAVPDARSPSGWAVPGIRPDGTAGLRAISPAAPAGP